MVADLNRITVVTLNRRHELDPAVAVLVVVPIDELGARVPGSGVNPWGSQPRRSRG